jgi:DNA polymerase III subunit epsilon
VPTSSPNAWQSTFQDLGRSLIDTVFVIVDLETTGGAPHLGAAITEIGAVKVKGGRVLGEFNTFVDPRHPVPSYITELTGITDEMLFQSPAIEELLPSLLDFLGSEDESVFVAHNAPFDLSFLKFAARSHGFAWPHFPVVDTAILSRKVLSRDEVPNCRLATLAQYFETETSPNHRALDDAKATLDIFHRLLERCGGYDIYTLEELLNFTSRKKRQKSPESTRPND